MKLKLVNNNCNKEKFLIFNEVCTLLSLSSLIEKKTNKKLNIIESNIDKFPTALNIFNLFVFCIVIYTLHNFLLKIYDFLSLSPFHFA